MATTSTASFNMDINTIVEEAFERNGAELRTGYELRTARRSLNLLTIEWASRGINLWTIEEAEIPLVQGQIEYNLPVDTIDILDMVVRTQSGINQSDINISRISESTYATIPNKNAQGRPIQAWINRQSGATNAALVVQYPTVNVWPCPDQSSFYTFVYWRLRRIEDVGNGVGTMDLPFRFLPAIVAGLAYYMCFKIPGGMERHDILKAAYEEQYAMAAGEDREKATLRIVPRVSYGR